VNWKRIVTFAAALFLAQVLVGFVDVAASGSDSRVATRQLALSTCLSFGLSAAIFLALSLRQRHRPLLHGCLALLLTAMFSLALAAALPAWLGNTPAVLVGLEWLNLMAGLVVGTSLGRYFAGRVRADA
jgi:nitrogen fixation/metabolism regulation signal transduction histidine kinase